MARRNRDLMAIMGEAEFERFFKTLNSYAQSLQSDPKWVGSNLTHPPKEDSDLKNPLI